MKLFSTFVLCLCVLFGCGYHFDGGGPEARTVTISVPYIKGDLEGYLNAELVKALTDSGRFDCLQSGGELVLDVAITGDGDDRIGYRFDRNPQTGELRDNIIGTENRRTINAQVSLIDAYTHTTVLGPQAVKADADYDYVDSNSIRDLVFFDPHERPQRVLDFSLGQLDSYTGAHDDSSPVIYRYLAQKIVEGLLVQRATDLFCKETGKREEKGEESQ